MKFPLLCCKRWSSIVWVHTSEIDISKFPGWKTSIILKQKRDIFLYIFVYYCITYLYILYISCKKQWKICMWCSFVCTNDRQSFHSEISHEPVYDSLNRKQLYDGMDTHRHAFSIVVCSNSNIFSHISWKGLFRKNHNKEITPKPALICNTWCLNPN